MRAKKTKKPARSIKYLLSANPKFQRISLRRISPLIEHARNRSRKTRSIESASAKRAFVLAAILITTVGVLIAANRPARPAGVAAAGTPPEATPRVDATAPPHANTPPDNVQATVRAEAPKTGVTKGPAASVAPETHKGDATIGSATTVESVAAAHSPAKSVAASESPVKTSAPELTAKPLAADSAEAASVQASPVTITGCLETDEETFWLKDTSGAETPKARSWKWGFLKKRSSNIELVDPAHTLDFATYVGQRVTATGLLTGRGMRAQSLHAVASSCN